MTNEFQWNHMLTEPLDDDASSDDVSVWLDDRNWDDAEYPGLSRSRRGVLTTNHPQSSYGIPVLVLHDSNLGTGGVRGVADLDDGAGVRVSMDDLALDIVQRAIIAGYPISDDTMTQPTFEGDTKTHGSIILTEEEMGALDDGQEWWASGDTVYVGGYLDGGDGQSLDLNVDGDTVDNWTTLGELRALAPETYARLMAEARNG